MILYDQYCCIKLLQRLPNNQKKIKMMNPQTHLNQERIRLAFESLGYSLQDYISRINLQQILDTLNNEQFDRQIFQELWQQCKLNSQCQTRIVTFIENLMKAEAILIENQIKKNKELKQLQKKLTDGNLEDTDKIQIRQEYKQLKEMKLQVISDKQRIRKPFHKFKAQRSSSKQQTPNTMPIFQISSQSPQQLISFEIRSELSLTTIFYLTIIGILGQMVVSFYLNGFMNTILFLLILNMYFHQHFDIQTVKFFMWFSIFTIFVDIVWFILQSKIIWSLDQSILWPSYLNKYHRLSFILISGIFIIKLLLVILLYFAAKLDENQPHEINIFGNILMLSSNGSVSPFRNSSIDFNFQGKRKSKNKQEDHSAIVD